ncbi:MAG: caspase family protein, partial [Nitrospirota bacterium]|nr:caspase family protein [Nitrospirota bacterium]
GAKVAVFFYAGHGLQLNNKNFLVPVDFDPRVEEYLGNQLIVLDTILQEMTRRTPVNVVFLDACRDNPFTDVLSARMTKGRSVAIDQHRGIQTVGTGLAEVKGSVGTLIAYATQPGNVAMDGEGDNSPFTLGLLQHLETPGLEVRELLMKVRGSVVEETSGVQIPWDHSSLMERFYFKKKRFRAPPPP